MFAQTVIPDSTLCAHPWLAELGDASLGETLSELSGVERSSYEYAWLPARRSARARAHCADADVAPAGLWARRSRIQSARRAAARRRKCSCPRWAAPKGRRRAAAALRAGIDASESPSAGAGSPIGCASTPGPRTSCPESSARSRTTYSSCGLNRPIGIWLLLWPTLVGGVDRRPRQAGSARCSSSSCWARCSCAPPAARSTITPIAASIRTSSAPRTRPLAAGRITTVEALILFAVLSLLRAGAGAAAESNDAAARGAAERFSR